MNFSGSFLQAVILRWTSTNGRTTVITKRGRVVAKIVPARAAKWDRSAVLHEAALLRTTIKLKKRVNVAKLIAEGRL